MSFVSPLSYMENWIQNFTMSHDQVGAMVTSLHYSRGVCLLAENSKKKQADLLKTCLCVFLLSNESFSAQSPTVSVFFRLGLSLGQSKSFMMFTEIEMWKGVGNTGGKFPSRWLFIS